MNRISWIAGAILASLALSAGCSSTMTTDLGGGEGFWSRLCSRRRCTTVEGSMMEGPILEDPGSCPGGCGAPPINYQGPPIFNAPLPQPAAMPPGQSNLPPLVPAPRTGPPQAQPTPYDPTATSRTSR